MTDPLSGSFHRPFDEQLAALELRMSNLVGTATWRDLEKAQHERAFVVAGAMKADLLDDLAKAVMKAASEGKGLEEFRRDFRKIVEARGWHGWTGEGTAKGEAWRTRVIYQTNMATSYAAGRMAQLKDGKFTFWVYKHGNAKEPRKQHLAWDGLALPPDHPFWETHAPPNGWGCTCRIRGANSTAGIKRAGGDPNKELPSGWDAVDPKTGVQVGIDKGWDYKVGFSAADSISLAARKVAALPPELGSDLGSSLQPLVDRAWQRWIEDTQSAVSHSPGFAGVLSQPVIDALDAIDRRPVSADILVNPALIVGRKARRHEQAGDALTQDQWLALPGLLQDPMAVALDKQSGKLLVILKGNDRVPQIAIELDQIIGKKSDPTQLANYVVSAYQPKISDLVGRAVGGLIKVILGSLV